jgi:hypothetical protein
MPSFHRAKTCLRQLADAPLDCDGPYQEVNELIITGGPLAEKSGGSGIRDQSGTGGDLESGCLL